MGGDNAPKAAAARPQRVLRFRHLIDSHKLANTVAVLALMAAYNAWDVPAAWLYLALHGTYGVLWNLKSAFFPDHQWERPVPSPIQGFIVVWGMLSLYWVAPWIIVSRRVQPAPWYFALCVSLYALGVFLHFASDMQKHTSLRLAPGRLFIDGLWSRCRNPNYLGELMIYLGFGLLAQSGAALGALGAVVVAIWVPNILKKEASLARYPEFAAWKARSWLIIPGIY